MEKIYTIPVNEAFDKSRDDHACGCPLCAIHDMLEHNELERIMGAAMMEPDVRKNTNELGFCHEHFTKMAGMSNSLGLALILESHLDELRERLTPSKLKTALGNADKEIKEIETVSSHCFVCEQIDFHFEKMLETAVLLWETEEEFRRKFAAQPYFCLPHYAAMLKYAKLRMQKKTAVEFVRAAEELELKYFDTLREDVKWYVKKFDYRYSEEPWGNAKDSPERAIKLLGNTK